MRCIGIFGGTFDPIHYGHLRTALELLHRLELEEVRFVPSGQPPHRRAPMLDARMRLRLVEAAIQREPGFVADGRELQRDGLSYSVDTLTSLREDFPYAPLGLILGMDAFVALDSWHEWQKLPELAHLIVAHRPGWELPDRGAIAELLEHRLAASASELHAESAGRVHIVHVTQLEISSTDLRSSIAEGIDPMYLVPPSVRDIIIETESYAQKKIPGRAS